MNGLEPTMSGNRNGESTDRPVRRVYTSPLAGTWYEADREVLTREIDSYLSQVAEQPRADICALLLPHAGYRWSGLTAAHGIKCLVGNDYRRVVVLGPSHRVPMHRVASVPDETHYVTPLGELRLDREFITELKTHSLFTTVPQAHYGEHSVQIELPLLQQVLGSFDFVPIVVGQLDAATSQNMGDVLRGLVDSQTLVVVSSDFTHYGSSFGFVPFRQDPELNLRNLDMGAMDQIRAQDLPGFCDYIDRTGATICGRHAIAVLLAMLPDETQTELLHYTTSGRISGDYSTSVSYLSLAFRGTWPTSSDSVSAAGRELVPTDRDKLLCLARSALGYMVKRNQTPTAEKLAFEPTPAMEQDCGAFVTLRRSGVLRGCVGEIYATRPLYEAVMAQAVNAGLKDSRFPPVGEAELDELQFEISALTPPRPVASPQEIEIGRHGIILRKDGHASVFLPKVAVEQGWGLEETLGQLAQSGPAGNSLAARRLALCL